MADLIYRQIADDLRLRIESGEFEPGTRLPTELELRDRYAASRNTIRDAMKFLITRGVIETRPGQGIFVVEEIAPVTVHLAAGREVDMGENSLYLPEVSDGQRFESSFPRVELQVADPMMCQRLRLPVGSPVVSRNQQRFIDSTPWSLQTSFYPRQLVLMGAPRLLDSEEISSGAFQYLNETLNIKQVGWDERLAVRQPDMAEIAFFRLPVDGRIPVIESIRTGYDQSGRPFRLTVTIYAADRNQFLVTMGEVPSAIVTAGEVPSLVGYSAKVSDAGSERAPEARAPAVIALER